MRRWSRTQVGVTAGVGIAVVAVLVLLVQSARPNGPAPLNSTDFAIVAYQGDDTLGGHRSTFAHVLNSGKPVLLNFFAGQCPPCRAEMPGFEKVYQQYQSKVIFVGVDVGPFLSLGTHDDAQNLLHELGITYPAAYAVDSSPLQLYQVVGMPTTIIFDAGGHQVSHNTGIMIESQLTQALQRVT